MNRVVVLLLFVNCHLSVFGQIDATLKIYHDRFVNEAKTRGIASMPVAAPTKMQFFNNGATTHHGIVFFQTSEVYINQLFWNSATEAQKEIVVFHELGHYYLKRGHVSHRPDIMNPDAATALSDFTTKRAQYLDAIFKHPWAEDFDIKQAFWQNPRTNMSLKAGDIIICSDTYESATYRVYRYNGTQQSVNTLDSIRTTHRQWDYINNRSWKYKTETYTMPFPSTKYGDKILEAWGERNRIYLYAHDLNKAPLLGLEGRPRWNNNTEMTLIIDYKTASLIVKNNATIIWYVKQPQVASDAKQIINK